MSVPIRKVSDHCLLTKHTDTAFLYVRASTDSASFQGPGATAKSLRGTAADTGRGCHAPAVVDFRAGPSEFFGPQ